ncbi:MAG TPA: hypothetical protein V6D22_09715 [Candidatus Obscuribacterales bacterium]
MKTIVLSALVAISLIVLEANRPAVALDTDVRAKLSVSRDALLAQLKEIQRNYDDVSRQMDDLRRKQALLDSYRQETESAISEVERAMAQTR